MKLSGAEIIVESLIEQGVDTVFGYPGGQVIDLYDALYASSDRLTHVLCSHEQHACHAADGYFRATGKVGTVIATSGPGATNLVTGIATAYLDSVPLIAITGNVSRNLIGRDSFQEVDITGVTLPVTKHNFFVSDPSKLAETIHRAFEIAMSGRPGPVLIDVPKDIQQMQIEYEPLGKAHKAVEKTVNEKQMAAAVEMINESQRPYIYIGGGSLGADVSKEIMELAEKIDAPIGCTLMGLSAVSVDHPRYLGMEGMHGHYASSMAQNECDLILAIGCRFSDRATGNVKKYARQAKILQLDIDAAELNKNVAVNLGLAGDIHDAVIRMLNAVDRKERPAWHQRIQDLKQEELNQQEQLANPHKLTPQALIHEVARYAEDATPIATDVGQHQMWVAQSYPFKQPRTFVSSGGLGTMGFGLGAAIGAAFGSKKRTLLFTGDGSFGMNLGELATLKATGAPVVIIVFNNKVLGMVRQWQTLFYGAHYSNTNLDERQSDFAKIAEAFGIPGFRIETLEEMPAVIARAMAKTGPVLIDVQIDRDEFVLPMLPPGGSMDQIITMREEI
ncbi:biosynthetic-type acetolactate synthase large subunit [Allobaculum mucilyticum]|uniref:biosynthetic-type acetolactate synthase large subunit n=1 Tax=Allobaculum mucilyticum TaxID=2834459 RepID=UPI001E4502C8|nr:biosynthetic-type acetolactate synthase large subunit [Allobaculum mucilyticum]UNT95422.1 biosynthetic-type acetolactate synthase large subunit [Allobaculum mucilyticum]